MEQLKLIDVGAFLFKRKKSILAITLIVAILIVLFTCVIGPKNEATFSMRIVLDSSLDSFVTQNQEGSTVIISGSESYPFDDAVTAYIESTKPTKAASGRINPYLNHNRLDIDSIQNALLEERYSDFLKSKGINALVDAAISTSEAKINILYDDNIPEEQFSKDIIEYTSQYLSSVIDEYISETLETHKKLIAEDEKEIAGILSEYSEVYKALGTDPLSNEKCRSLLNSYAQAAYNYDVSNAVINLSNQLGALDIQPIIELIDEDFQYNTSFGKIAVFSIFGIIIGLIFACFFVYICSLCFQIYKKVKVHSETKDTDTDD